MIERMNGVSEVKWTAEDLNERRKTVRKEGGRNEQITSEWRPIESECPEA